MRSRARKPRQRRASAEWIGYASGAISRGPCYL